MPRLARIKESSFAPLDDGPAVPIRRRKGSRDWKASVACQLRDLAEDVSPQAWAKIEKILVEVEK